MNNGKATSERKTWNCQNGSGSACNDLLTGVSPYYSDRDVAIYHGDARDLLPRVSVVVDCIVTDPPYGIEYRSNMGKRFDAIAGDDSPCLWWIAKAKRFLKPAARLYCFASERQLGAVQTAFVDEGMTLTRMLVWDKQAMTCGDLNDYGARTEYIVPALNRGDSDLLRGSRDANLISVPRIDTRLLRHPCEKPVRLIEYVIVRATDAGQTVLDPFCGCGTTLEAAKALGRRAIGFECEERWCEMAANRCRQGMLDFAS